MSNRFKIVLFSLPVFFILSIALIKTAPLTSNKKSLVSSVQAQTEVDSDKLFTEENENNKNGLKVDNVNTKYFKARVGTTWEYSGYKREEGVKEEEGSHIKRKKVYREVTVLNIEKKADHYQLEVSDSEMDDNQVWLVSDDYFLNESSYMEFPLYYGKRWLNKGEDDGSEFAEMTKKRKDAFYQNRVEELMKKEVMGNDCYVVGHNTAPSRFYSIFCDNIGIVENYYKHRGSISEYRENLVKYRY